MREEGKHGEIKAASKREGNGRCLRKQLIARKRVNKTEDEGVKRENG